MKSAGNLTREDGVTIAYRRTPGRAPGVVFLGGFRSDMSGTKAIALEAHCRRVGRAYVRLDYRGHGESTGRFEDGTIGLWAGDAIAVLDAATEGPQILVGSSMGGWIMLLAALARPDRVTGLVGIAAAPDFTEDLIWARYPQEVRDAIMREGVILQPSEYDPNGYPITRGLIEDGRKHLLLRAPIDLGCPVRLLHGMRDPDVPWQTALRLTEGLTSDDVTVTLIKDGDHRLSRDQDIARICAAVDALG
jgi:pimeloyl-ACP methyl ester carboxylesterase